MEKVQLGSDFARSVYFETIVAGRYSAEAQVACGQPDTTISIAPVCLIYSLGRMVAKTKEARPKLGGSGQWRVLVVLLFVAATCVSWATTSKQTNR